MKTREIAAFGGVSLALREWEALKIDVFTQTDKQIDKRTWDKEIDVFAQTDRQTNK